jgi:hypothetical protein
VINLNLSGSYSNYGYYDFYVENVDTSENITTAKSAHWYLSGVNDLVKVDYSKTGTVAKVVIKPTDNSHIKVDLPDVEMTITEANADIPYKRINGDVSGGEIALEIDHQTNSVVGLVCRVTFSGDKDFKYIREFEFVKGTGIGGGSGGGTSDSDNPITRYLERKGWDNKVTYWIITLLLWAILVIAITWKAPERSKSVLIGVATVLIGVGMIAIGWLDIWDLMLMSAFAGLLIFATMRKLVGGKGT